MVKTASRVTERSWRSGRTAAAVVLLALAACGRGEEAGSQAARLAPLPIDPSSVTVSGISSGGHMAVQFHVAHSALVQGAGVLAGGPYFCSEGSVRLSLGRCLKGDEEIPTSHLLELTSQLALDGAIDPIAGLADDRVWIFHGAADPYVRAPVTDALVAYYQALVRPEFVTRVEHPQASHTFPTADVDAPSCAVVEPPFLGNCGLDGARALLEHLYGKLADGRAAGPTGLVEFDQRPYAASSGSRGLADRGWLYIPAGCDDDTAANCRLHVVFHGCKQGASFVGDAFVRRAGYLEVAEANRIVLLFPQIEPGYQPLNPYGCWDWWGYESESFATHDGPQVLAVRAMVADLTGEARPAP